MENYYVPEKMMESTGLNTKLIFRNLAIQQVENKLNESEIIAKQIQLQKDNNLRVQLLFTSFGAGRVASFFLSKYAKYGLVHAIIKIGLWTFDWDDVGLIEAQFLSPQDRKNELFAIDIGSIQVYDFLKNKLENMLQLISLWNTTKKYEPKLCNCQAFTEELITVLGLKEAFNSKVTGNLALYLNSIRENGPQDLWFSLDNKRKVFKTHRELDIFENEFFEKYPEKFTPSNPDFLLLKSFDRVFWHKYHDITLPTEEIEPYKPIPICKFKDPEGPGNTDQVALSMIS